MVFPTSSMTHLVNQKHRKRGETVNKICGITTRFFWVRHHNSGKHMPETKHGTYLSKEQKTKTIYRSDLSVSHHSIHGTKGIFTYMNGRFVLVTVGKYTIVPWILWVLIFPAFQTLTFLFLSPFHEGFEFSSAQCNVTKSPSLR